MRGYGFVTIVSIAEIISLLGIATFPSLQPILIKNWSLSHTEVGWINGIYFLGYLVFVPILVSLTDRRSPKKIFLASTLIIAFSGVGFAYLADGFWSAMFFRLLAGIGLAGTYMPGLKLLSDHMEAINPSGEHSRAVAFYTSSFGLGSALSYFLAGEIEIIWGWKNAFLFSGLGALLSFIIIFFAASKEKPYTKDPLTNFLNFRPVFKAPQVMGYVFAYAIHNFELFAFRSWIVSYLAFAMSVGPPSNFGLSATLIAAATNIVGLPSSIIGNEISRRIGRHRTITIIMLISALFACLMGVAVHLPFWAVVMVCMIYGITVTGESSSITAGVIAASPKGQKGATMAVHASIGFIGSFLGPLAFGIMLDLTYYFGGQDAVGASWIIAFAFIGIITALGPLFLLVKPR